MILKKILNSIAIRISVSIAVIVAATAMAVGFMILREELKSHEYELRNKGRYLAELMSHQVVEPLLYEERFEIYSFLKAPMKGKESFVVYAEVYDKNGEAVATVYKDEKYKKTIPQYPFNELINHPEQDDPLILHLNLPINVTTFETIGFLRMGITKEFHLITHNKVKQKLYLLAAVIIIVGILLGLWIARKILRPILILHKGVKMVGKGEVGLEVPVVGEGEIKELALSFNNMSRKLKGLIDTIKAARDNLVRTEKLYAIGEFSAGVAHEIKNPLTSIKMLMQTVQQKKQSLTSRDIDVIEEEINRIDHIIKEFLAFARPEKAEKTDLNIGEVLEEVITITKPKMEQSHIHLDQKLSSSLPVVKGNHDALKQVYLNLVLNAIQSMDSKGGALNIETYSHNGTLSTVISDTGNGIPEKDLDKIFDPFFTTKEEGTGMGLALTHNIINDHAGSINIDSSEGIGTKVTVELPI